MSTPTLEILTTELAQAAMILTLSPTQREVERDTMRTIMEEDYHPDGSYEQIAQVVEQSSMIAKLDLLNFWEQLAFGWVVGCESMGYDDFALYAPHRGLYALSPIFSLCVSLSADDELPLSLNGKRRGVTRADFEVAMKRSGVRAKIINNLFARFVEALPKWCAIIEESQLSDVEKSQYKAFLTAQVKSILVRS